MGCRCLVKLSSYTVRSRTLVHGMVHMYKYVMKLVRIKLRDSQNTANAEPPKQERLGNTVHVLSYPQASTPRSLSADGVMVAVSTTWRRRRVW